MPERREERTTEGGLDVAGGGDRLARTVGELRNAGIRVSLFIEPQEATIAASARIGADIVELHTGSYCEKALTDDARSTARELDRLARAARVAHEAGLEVHAGHGLTFDTVGGVSRMPQIVELNIGHFLIGEAIFVGLPTAITRMRMLMDEARAQIGPAGVSAREHARPK